jgi:hypothetical protein
MRRTFQTSQSDTRKPPTASLMKRRCGRPDLDANGCGKKTGRQAESDQTSSDCRTEPDMKSVALEKRKVGLKND